MVLAPRIGRAQHQQLSPARRNQGRTIVQQIVAVREKYRTGPGISVVGGDILGPDGALRGRPPHRMGASDSQPQTAGLIDAQPGRSVFRRWRRLRSGVIAAVLGEVENRNRPIDGGTLPPAGIDFPVRNSGKSRAGIGIRFHRAPGLVDAAQADSPAVIDGETAGLIRAPILAPPFATLFVGDPERSGRIVGDRRICFVARARGDGRLRAPASRRGCGAYEDVVIPVAVGIPGDAHMAVRIGGDGRVPFVARGLRDRRGLREGAPVLRGGEDGRAAVAPALPRHPDASGGIPRSRRRDRYPCLVQRRCARASRASPLSTGSAPRCRNFLSSLADQNTHGLPLPSTVTAGR